MKLFRKWHQSYLELGLMFEFVDGNESQMHRIKVKEPCHLHPTEDDVEREALRRMFCEKLPEHIRMIHEAVGYHAGLQ